MNILHILSHILRIEGHLPLALLFNIEIKTGLPNHTFLYHAIQTDVRKYTILNQINWVLDPIN